MGLTAFSATSLHLQWTHSHSQVAQPQRRPCRRAPTLQQARAASSRHMDPGSWELSPEWMGSQGGGWGRNSGRVLFSRDSACGNGQVFVTSHPASRPGAPTENDAREEWRVLRFNEDTRQSVCRVRVTPDRTEEADPTCLAFEYLKTLASVFAGVIAHMPPAFDGVCHDVDESSQPLRVLCIGLGGGTLPLFISHHFPGAEVEVAEVDPVVVDAATHCMAFPQERQRLRLHKADGVELVAEWAREGQQADVVIIDAFDGNDQVPPALTAEGSAFPEDLAQVLDASHGVLIMNLHSGPKLSIQARLQRKVANLPDPGFDPAGEKGREVARIARVFRDAILWPIENQAMAGLGIAFTVACPKQQNAALVVARGLSGDYSPLVNNRLAGELFEAAATRVGETVGYRFDPRGRAGAWMTPVEAL